MYEWLKNLKVGDSVGLDTHYHGLFIETISRITKTMLITENGRYSRHNGRAIGTEGFHTNYLREVTEEFLNKYNRELYTGCIKGFVDKGKLAKLTVEELSEVYLKLKDYEKCSEKSDLE